MLRHFCHKHGWGYEVMDRPDQKTIDPAEGMPTFRVRAGAHSIHTKILRPEHRAFQLIRDPRDALVSGYWSWRNSHANNTKEILKTRERLDQLPIDDGLIIMLDHLPMLNGLRDWPIGEITNLLDMRYEDLLRDTPGGFKQIFDFLGIDLTDEHIDQLVTHSSFETITGRAPGQEDTSNHFRKGIAGDWKNAFTPKVAEAFRDRYQADLVRLGYETDDTWVAQVQTNEPTTA